MKTRILQLAMAGIFLLSFAACDSLLEAEPEQSVSSEVALSTWEGFVASLHSSYDRLRDESWYGQDFILYPDALADNITNASANSNRYPAVEANDAHLTRYAPHYAAINELNAILAELPEFEDTFPDFEAHKRQLEGEALFLRALNYFDLVRTKAYEPGREVGGWTQGVIIRTEPTRGPDDADFRARSSNEEVYDLILTDLDRAASLMDGYVEIGSSSQGAFGLKHRANKAAAHALKARVHLYAGEMGPAETEATNAINEASEVGARLTEGDEYIDSWQAEVHPEALLEIFMISDEYSGSVTGLNESIVSLTRPVGWGDLAATDDLLNAHENGDVRLDLYEEAEKSGEELTYSLKWTETRGPYTHNIPLIRMSELYLIRAEARYENGNQAGAEDDLNTVRNARGLGNWSGSDLERALMNERRVEFAFEGHRFFDLKRREEDIPKPQQNSEVSYADYRILASLPQTQVDLNPELDQNPGY